MQRRDILALVFLVIVALVSEVLRSDDPVSPDQYAENPRRPAPQQPGDGVWDAQTRAWMSEAATPAPRRSLRGVPQEAVIEVPEERGSGTGTAFAIGPGIWLTARHVVDGCDRIGLLREERRGIKVTQVLNHPNADVALLRTRNAPPAYALGGRADTGNDGFMVGFPKGQPGAVHGTKIGTTVLREKGRFQTRERTDVWAERARIPDRFDSLGGLSGGPVFLSDGRIVGVVLAEERRRGRILTAQPETLQVLLQQQPIPANAGRAPTLTAVNFPREARDMLLSLRVSKVICRVG